MKFIVISNTYQSKDQPTHTYVQPTPKTKSYNPSHHPASQSFEILTKSF